MVARSAKRLFGMVRVLLLVLAFGAPAAWSQQGSLPTPTPEQLEILRNLPPEERERLLNELGLGQYAETISGALDGTSRQNGGADRQRNGRTGAARAGDDRLGREQRLGRDGLLGDEEEDPSVLRAEDTVLLDVLVRMPRFIVEQPGNPASRLVPDPQAEPLPKAERKRLEALVTLIRSRNPYQLDESGMLQLPGFRAIALLGLNEEQATKRLLAEPDFDGIDVTLTRLPLKKTGQQGLQAFGYDLFEQDSDTFEPLQDVPVPADYVVGPGDELNVQLYGSQNRNLRLVVSRDGRVSFPELGPISVVGKRFSTVRSDIEGRVARQMIGTRASVSMGDVRGIAVFVLGEVKRPGTHTVSGLATITTALFASGGVREIGSLRDIQLKRQGAVIRRLDLYDMLLRGDTSDDAKLLPGDVVFVPPVGSTVAVDGEVRRPAIYELKGTSTVADLLQIAGGLTAEADSARGSLARIDEQKRRVVLDVDLTAAAGRSQLLRNGDSLRVLRVRPTLDSGVLVQGHVHAPTAAAYREGLRLSDVVRSVDDLKPNADLGYLLIRRELPPDRRITVVSADLSAALREPGGAADVPLMPRDQITVFDLESGRDRVIEPVLNEMRLQARIERPTEIVTVAGRVRVEGDYPLEPGMTVRDLLRAGGGLSDSAFGSEAELTRYTVGADGARGTQLVKVDLAAVQRGDAAANITLQPFDLLNVKETPSWAQQEQVTIEGEVKFPGVYPIRRGETLRSVLTRAGGITDLAFPEGAVFMREDLKKREQEQLDVLAGRLQNDLATLALQGAAANQAQAGTALQVGQSLLGQLRGTKAVGRLVINFPRVIASDMGSNSDIVLRDGDTLLVPRRRQEVTVIGEVQNSTSHFFRAELGRDDYVGLSGGITRKADRGRIYVVRADGSVVASESSRWFSRAAQVQMRPGDTVVVPLDTERLPALPLWQAVTQILYNLAVSVAAVNSF
jgi:protein involved in polysaccharide export with SLBB domain